MKLKASEKIPPKEKTGKGILDENKNEKGKGFPHECEECGYGYADVVDLGASYSDEASVFLFKCRKCGHVTRDVYGSSK